MNKLLGYWFSSIILCSSAFAQTTIYSWVDDKGVVHFTDRASNPKAAAYELKGLEVKSSAEIKGEITVTDDLTITIDPPKPALPPASISIVNPIHEQTIRNDNGKIRVTAVTNRTLDNEFTVQLLLDGKAHQQPQTELIWHLNNINRGQHQIQIQLQQKGKVIASSESITVYLHRPSILLPPKPHPVQPKEAH